MEPLVQQIVVLLAVVVLTSSDLWALVHKRADKYNSNVVLESGDVLAFLEAKYRKGNSNMTVREGSAAKNKEVKTNE